MGIQENTHRTRLRRNQLQQVILGTVATAGLIGVAVVAPQVLIAMKKLDLLPSPRQRAVIGRAIPRLIEKGFLVREGKTVRVTEKGRMALAVSTHRISEVKSRAWDGKWRVLIFDIPEYRKGLRQKIRNSLRAVGFVRVQDSVWVYPHDCEDYIVLLKADFRIGKDMLYMIVDSLEGDAALLTYFKLKKR